MAVDVKTFATELARSLTKRGIPKDLAIKHAVSLVRTFDEEDLREIASYSAPEEFEELSNSLAELIKDKEMPDADGAADKADGHKADTAEVKDENKGAEDDTRDAEDDGLDKTVGAPESFAEMKRAPRPHNKPAASHVIPKEADVNDTVTLPRRNGGHGRPIPIRAVTAQPAPGTDMSTRAFSIEGGEAIASANETRTFANIKTGDIAIVGEHEKNASPASTAAAADEQEIYLDDDGTLPEEPGKVKLTGKGKAVFVGVCVAAFIPALVVALLVLGIFALGIVTVCAFIVAAILLLCAETVAGCGATLVGIIYGAIEIVSGSPGIGIYEIGLGIACGGAAMFFSILTYNLAVVAMPYILKQLITFEGYCLKEVGPMIRRFKGRCAGI